MLVIVITKIELTGALIRYMLLIQIAKKKELTGGHFGIMLITEIT